MWSRFCQLLHPPSLAHSTPITLASSLNLKHSKPFLTWPFYLLFLLPVKFSVASIHSLSILLKLSPPQHPWLLVSNSCPTSHPLTFYQISMFTSFIALVKAGKYLLLSYCQSPHNGMYTPHSIWAEALLLCPLSDLIKSDIWQMLHKWRVVEWMYEWMDIVSTSFFFFLGSYKQVSLELPEKTGSSNAHHCRSLSPTYQIFSK
jgi:hypothetical protein